MRPREMYAHHGPERFGDAELIALVLGTGTASRSALEMAAGLLTRFDGLEGLVRSDPRELEAVPGIGFARAIRLHAALQVGRRATSTRDPGAPVLDASDARDLLAPRLEGLANEELHALYLDRRRRPLALRQLTKGSDGFTVVDPRQVYRVAVHIGASAVILAHNHPSGDPRPSAQDRDVTERVARAGRVLGVSLLDHLVIAGNTYTSLAEEGMLQAWPAAGPSWTAS